MPALEVKLEHLEGLHRALSNYRSIATPILNMAINAALAEIHKQAVDENFQFKTPRSKRTGFLSLSFAYGLNLATGSDLQGSIGPTARYALFVHEGTGRFPSNPFMERIARIVQEPSNKHFENALERIAETIAERTKL